MFWLLGAIGGYTTATGEKADWVRLLDVFIIGPMMISAGKRTNSPFLQLAGGATITLNLVNYLKSRSLYAGQERITGNEILPAA